MAEEQFTSRRARREAERLAAEQAFEARETPEQPSEPAADGPADLLNPAPEAVEEPDSGPTEPEAEVAEPVVPEPEATEAAEPEPEAAEAVVPEPEPVVPEPEAAEAAEPEPEPAEAAEAAESESEAAESVDSASRLDPQRSPLPHFETRSARKAYLREHGLSLEGDVSTGAIPTIAEPEESVNDAELEEGTTSETESVDPESFDTAGFGGSADEVAARDFESPVTPDSAPRPVTLDEEPVDALSPTQDSPHSTDSPATDESTSEATTSAESITEDTSEETATPAAQDSDTDEPGLAEEGAGATAVHSETADDEAAPRARSRRMPIVQPPTTSGVRVVTAASAQVPEVDSPETDHGEEADEAAKTEEAPGLDQTMDSDQRLDSEADTAANEEETASSSDDAARALAANPETRPMDTVPEAWALPNSDYEDEETENPPGTRIRASDVTGHDGRILVGEEPSKVPFVVLGVAAIFAVALIVIALIMLL